MDDDLDLDLQSAAVQPEIEYQNSDKNPKWVCPEVKWTLQMQVTA